MAKISRVAGPSLLDGTRPRAVRRLAGTDLELVGGDLVVGGDITAGDDLTVAGVFSGAARPSRIEDEVVITTPTADLAVNGFALTPVPNMLVTAPDVDDPLLVRLRGPIINTPSRAQTVGINNASPNITGPANAFSADDEGRDITGTGIPAGTKIVAVTSETAAVISNAATATNPSLSAIITGGTSSAGLAIAAEPNPTIGEQLDVGWVQLTSGSAAAQSVAEVWLDPHSPGTFYAMAYSLATGTLRVDATNLQKARMQVMR